MKRISLLIAFAGLLTTTACQQSTTDQTAKDAQLAAQQQTIDSMKYAMDRQHVIDSMNAIAEQEQRAKQTAVAAVATKATPAKRVTRKKSNVSQSGSNTYAGHTQPVYTQPAPVVYEQPAKQKKGWSAKAKGAVIGAGVGAATGAIVNKRNRGAGAVIGGVLGAGAGTGVGAVIDKKKGR